MRKNRQETMRQKIKPLQVAPQTLHFKVACLIAVEASKRFPQSLQKTRDPKEVMLMG